MQALHSVAHLGLQGWQDQGRGHQGQVPQAGSHHKAALLLGLTAGQQQVQGLHTGHQAAAHAWLASLLVVSRLQVGRIAQGCRQLNCLGPGKAFWTRTLWSPDLYQLLQ